MDRAVQGRRQSYWTSYESGPEVTRSPHMQRSYTMLMTRSSRRTGGHGVASYKLLGRGCS
eukprot:300184-Alexandrium_andersonii.AAC.1